MKRFLPHLIAFIVVAIWGVTFVCTKLLLLGGLTAAQIFILRFIIGTVLILYGIYLVNTKHPKLST